MRRERQGESYIYIEPVSPAAPAVQISRQFMVVQNGRGPLGQNVFFVVKSDLKLPFFAMGKGEEM